MCQSLVRSIMFVGLLGITGQPILAQNQQSNRSIDPRFVVEQVKKRLDIISNYQCTQTSRVERSNETKHLAFDSQGRGCVRVTGGKQRVTTTIWDGKQTVKVHERVWRNGTVNYSATIIPGKCFESFQENRPWSYLGGDLLWELTAGLEDGGEVNIVSTEEGHCRVEIRNQLGGITVRVLDPNRGYLPIREERIGGRSHHREDIEFKEIKPGIWFPVAMQIAGQPGPKFRFTNIKVNDPTFGRLLTPVLPDGSTVADGVRGVRYVVDHERGLNIAGSPPTSVTLDAVSPRPSEALYRLEEGQTLKRIAPAHPVSRSQFINSGSTQAQESEVMLRNAIYILEWNGDREPDILYTGDGFLTLSEVLQYVCGLGIAQISGPEEVLDSRLTGDWIVRPDAPQNELVHALEPILRAETGKNITFERRRVTTQIVRATGIFRYCPLPGAAGEYNVQLFTERSASEPRIYVGGGSGTLAQFLRHITNRTGRRIEDETLSSSVFVFWSDYISSKLSPYTPVPQEYREDLSQLLEHAAQQTGLTFTEDRRTIDDWLVEIHP